PPPDATPPPDSSAPDAAGPDAAPYTYALQLSDFLTGAPPVGAKVDVKWEGSSLNPVAYSGTVNDAGLLYFPDPPADQKLLSYHVLGNGGESSLYWLSVVIVPPPGRTTYSSLLA